MQLIEIFYLLFTCDQKQDFVNLLNGQCQKNPFLRMWRQRKVFLSLDITGWTMINHPVCKLELTLKSDEGEKGSALIKSIFHLSYFFIKRGKIKCCRLIFVVTIINFIKTSSWEPFQNTKLHCKSRRGGKRRNTINHITNYPAGEASWQKKKFLSHALPCLL